MKIEPQEALHILVSVLTISLAFSFLQQNISLSGSTVPIFDIFNFIVVLVTVGLGCILHELAHKFVAIKSGAYAQYQAWTLGLVLTIVTAVMFGFVFAAPGAVYIYGHVTRETNGKISLAGPGTNLILAMIFIAAALAMPSIRDIALIGAYVNTFLGAFNMIPIPPLDGSKVLALNPLAWAGTLALLATLFFTIPAL